MKFEIEDGWSIICQGVSLPASASPIVMAAYAGMWPINAAIVGGMAVIEVTKTADMITQVTTTKDGRFCTRAFDVSAGYGNPLYDNISTDEWLASEYMARLVFQGLTLACFAAGADYFKVEW